MDRTRVIITSLYRKFIKFKFELILYFLLSSILFLIFQNFEGFFFFLENYIEIFFFLAQYTYNRIREESNLCFEARRSKVNKISNIVEKYTTIKQHNDFRYIYQQQEEKYGKKGEV